ncbi:MAG TPA: enoyl-CoA hydratase-related protein [Acidimicrobiales bacterium]|nr:enoyl-CoA hydratase-related protein [Acidimicrobiales bacterium]
MARPSQTSEPPLVRRADHGLVAELVLDRPGALNAISTAMARQLTERCEVISAEGLRGPAAVALTSSCERAFSAGADLKERARFGDADMLAQRPVIRAAFEAVRSLPVPAIAAVAGYALGGGYELALCCDVIVADETAEIALPEVTVGLVPGGGGTQLLARRSGPGTAADLILSGRRVRAGEALRLRLVDRVVAAGTAVAAALELAQLMAANSPIAVRAAKRALRSTAEHGLATGLEVEDAAWRAAATSEDRVEGISAFVGKKQPAWPSRK